MPCSQAKLTEFTPEMIVRIKLEAQQTHTVDLSMNWLESLPVMTDLRRITTLDLGHNKFEIFPDELFACTKLTKLVLTGNRYVPKKSYLAPPFSSPLHPAPHPA